MVSSTTSGSLIGDVHYRERVALRLTSLDPQEVRAAVAGARLAALRLAPDGRPRPEAPFGRGPLAARVLARGDLGGEPVGPGYPPADGASARRSRRHRRVGRSDPASAVAGGEPRPRGRGRPVTPDVGGPRSPRDRERGAAFRRSPLGARQAGRSCSDSTVVEGREHLVAALGAATACCSSRPMWAAGRSRLRCPARSCPCRRRRSSPTTGWPGRSPGHASAPALGSSTTPSRSRAPRRSCARAGRLVLGDYAKDSMRTYPVRFLDAVAVAAGGRSGAFAALRHADRPVLRPAAAGRGAGGSWSSPARPPARNGGAEAERALLQELADTVELPAPSASGALGSRVPDRLARIVTSPPSRRRGGRTGALA